MKIQIFPFESERKTYHTRLLWYTLVASGFLVWFWMWHFIQTGEVASSVWGYPRLFDAPAIVVWVVMLVGVGWLVEYAHIHPYQVRAGDYLSIHMLAFLKRFLAHCALPLVIVLSIVDTWKVNADLPEIVFGYSGVFLGFAIAYGAITFTLSMNRFFHRFFADLRSRYNG